MQKITSLFVILILMGATVAQAQNYDDQTLVTKAKFLGKSIPMKDLVEKPSLDKTKLAETKKNLPKKFFPNFHGKTPTVATNKNALPQGPDPTWQRSFTKSGAVCVEPLVNREGMNNAIGGATPPDPTGAVGKDYFIQMVNSTFFQIFDKTGEAVTGPTNLQSFWQQFGHGSGGDPIILYDQGADRWVFTEFPPFQNFLLMAVSETSDPLGSWNAYEFSTPSFPDYPKYALWNNAYVVTTNEGGDIPVYAMDREAMLAGESDATVVRMTVPRIGTGPSFQVVTPINWSGKIEPPVGLDPMIIRMVDDAWGTTTEDKLEIWSIDVDWDNPSAASISMTNEVITQPFDSYPCGAETGGFACTPQPNPNQGVDSQVEIIMHQVHYRNFGSHESVVLNFIADASGGDNHTGIRWFELRKALSPDWAVHQEGNYAPDEHHRYMGGIAIDGSGNIGLGLSISSSTIFPSLAFTGRRSSDPLGEMTITEHRIVDGQSNTGSRYGDYAQMTVDPVDNRTFWYTGEYMSNSGNWSTRIFSFQMQDTLDAVMTALVSPTSSSSLSASEVMSLEILNAGMDSIEQFDISYSIDGAPFVKVSVDSLLRTDDRYVHTFMNNEDFSGPGPFNIRCAVFTAEDRNRTNDTLNVQLIKYLERDVAVTSVRGPQGIICDTTANLEITIENLSDVPLTSARIYIEHNALLVDSIDWTGSLGLSASTTLDYTISELSGGLNDIRVYASMPNGLMDQNDTNNDQSTTLEVLGNATTLILTLQLDEYPNETSWAIKDDNGATIFSGGNYTQRELIVESFCVDPEDCFTFEIYDDYGDGLIGLFGGNQGFYTITDEQGTILVNMEEINFGDIATHDFCATFECMMTATFDVAPSQVNGSDGVIVVDALNGTAPYQYSFDGGSSFQAGNTFNGLPPGMYDIVIVDANDCTYAETIEIFGCAIMFLVESTPATGPNNADGSIDIQVTGGAEPIQYSIDGGQTYLTSAMFNGLLPGSYDIIVVDAQGCEVNLDDFILDFVSSTENPVVGRSIQVFPNPTNGLFTLEVRDPSLTGQEIKIEILDMQGKRITQSRITKYNDFYTGQISILTYPAGTYLIRFVNKELNNLVKLIKE